MKKLFSSLLSFFIFGNVVLAQQFSDVPATHPHATAIAALQTIGILNGYEDGSFRPAAAVNRAEAVKMIFVAAAMDVASDVQDTGFNDVSADAWFASYVREGKELGILSGDGATGNFNAGRQVNTVEFLKILIETFGKDISSHQDGSSLSADTQGDEWFLSYLSYAKTLGLIVPDLQNNLNPQKTLSRGECADILYKFLTIENGGDVQKFLSISEAHLVNVIVALNQDDIQMAKTEAENAVLFAEQAQGIAPDQGIVNAAVKISQGFLELALGYEAGLNKDVATLQAHALAAKELAGFAYVDDPSTQPLGKKIKQQADVLLAQVE